MYLQPLLQKLPCIPGYAIYPHLTVSLLAFRTSHFVLYNFIFLSCLFLSWHVLYELLYKLNVHYDFLEIFHFFSWIGVRALSLNTVLSCAMRATCFLQSVILDARHCHALVHNLWQKKNKHLLFSGTTSAWASDSFISSDIFLP